MSATWKIECTDGKKDAIPVSVGKTVIGRGHLLQIRELKVSRHHAEVQIAETGEFVLKAMHPGLPCFYNRKDEETKNELQRGATIELKDGDIFSLHANPDCEFKVIKSDVNDQTDVGSGDDGQQANKKVVEEKSDDGNEEADSEQQSEEDDGSDWSDGKGKQSARSRSGTNRQAAKKKPAKKDTSEEEDDDGSDYSDEKPKAKSKARSSRKPVSPRSNRRPAAKRRKPASSEEVSNEESEEGGSDNDTRRSRRQTPRVQQRLPARRATKPVSYNEDLMLEGMSPSASEQESDDGLPKIGRQKKRDSDSDFKVDDDSGSDWDEGRKASKGSKKSGVPSSRKGRRKRNSGSSESEPEYIPRASKRRGAAAPKERTKCKFAGDCYRKNKDHKEEFIHPGDSDWSDSSQDEAEDEGDVSVKGSENGSE